MEYLFHLRKFPFIARNIFIKLKSNYSEICVIRLVNEAIGVEPACVCDFTTVGQGNFFSFLDVDESLDVEASQFFGVAPLGLLGHPMVAHVSQWYHDGVFLSVQLDSESAAVCDLHGLHELLHAVLAEFNYFLIKHIVYFIQNILIFFNIINKRASLQPIEVFLMEESWETIKIIMVNIYYSLPIS